MFKVYRLKDDQWMVATPRKAFPVGDRVNLIKVLLSIGVESNEVYDGLNEMVTNDHDVADYGVNKTFIYSARLK